MSGPLKTLFLFEIVEHYDDEPSEHWGQEVLDHVPVVGEVVQLHWLDKKGKFGGENAHKLKVIGVDNSMGYATIHGERVDGEDGNAIVE